MSDFVAQNTALVSTLALIMLGIGSELLKRWLDHEVMAAALHAQTAEKAAQYAVHTGRLEARVRVPERTAPTAAPTWRGRSTICAYRPHSTEPHQATR